MAKIRVLAESPPPMLGADSLRELRDYISRLREELEYLMTHLDTDNMLDPMAGLPSDVKALSQTLIEETERLDGEILRLDGKIDEKVLRETVLYNPGNPGTDITSDTTVTLTQDFSKYSFLRFIMYNASPGTNTTRIILTVPTLSLSSRAHYPIARASNYTSLEIGVGSTPGTTVRFYSSGMSPLIVRYIYGLR